MVQSYYTSEQIQEGIEMPDETITIASEQKRLERLQTELVNANKASDVAIAAMSKRQRDAGIDELLTLADAVRDSKRLSDKARSAISAVQSGVKRLEWEVKAKPLMDARNRVRDATNAAIAHETAIFKQFGVERLTTSTDTTTDTPLTAINIAGEAIPKAPSGVKRSGGGGGGGKVPMTVDGTEYASASAALMATFPDFEGKMGRAAITSKLTTAGHNVS